MINYIEELFKWVELSGDVNAFYQEDESCNFELKIKMGSFLDLISAFAEKNNISEVHKTDGNGSDNRFCYWIKFKDQVIEIGMYYDDVVYATDCPDDVRQKNVIDCEDVIRFYNSIIEENNKLYKKLNSGSKQKTR